MRRRHDAHGGNIGTISTVIFGACAGLLAGTTLLLAPGAQAAAGPSSCVTNVSSGATQCFATAGQAETAARGAALTTSSRVGSSTGTAAVQAAAASVTIGRIYEHADFGGAVHIYTAAGGCDSDPDMDRSRDSMPSGWNDVVSSYRGYNGCQVKLWDNEFQSGPSYGPLSSASSVGSMNDRASSVSFH